MDFLTATDTADASTYLRSVNQTDGSFSEHFLMPISGFENNGLPVTPKGYDKAFDLYLTVDATGKGTIFDSLNVTLWVDPQGNDGAAGVSETSDPSFSNGRQDDIALATGTMVSAHLTMDSSGARHADFVENLTPTLAGTTLSGGSLKEDTLLEEQLSPGPDTTTQSLPQADGTTVNLLANGVAKIDAPSFDAVHYQNNVFSTVQPDGTFVSHRLDPVTGFTLNGDSVVPAGFGPSYGLYFDITDTGVSTPTSLSFASSTFKLMYDPGNQDGAVTSTVNGITFANTGPSGAADDIVLGTGTMVSGVASFDPATGIRTTHFVETFTPTPDASELSPFVNSPAVFDLVNSGPASLLVNRPGPNGTILQTINGATGVAEAVPDIGEEATIFIPTVPGIRHDLRFIYDHGPHGHDRRSC